MCLYPDTLSSTHIHVLSPKRIYPCSLSVSLREVVGPSGLEPPTSRLSGARSSLLSYGPICRFFGGDEGIRTPDPLLAGQVLSQLSYTPVSRGRGSSSLSQRPFIRTFKIEQQLLGPIVCRDYSFVKTTADSCGVSHGLLRKEVIQPHLPIRLPCYDLTPIIEPTFGSSLLAVRTLTSGLPDFHGLTGGVYKARERIHRDILIRDY